VKILNFFVHDIFKETFTSLTFIASNYSKIRETRAGNDVKGISSDLN
jgi:hypothetical protein